MQLTTLAQELGPGSKMPNIIELCDTLEASKTSMGAALKELEAKHIVYRKHGVGIYVSPQVHHRAVVLICDPLYLQTAGSSPFWQVLIDCAKERATKKNERFSLHFSRAMDDSSVPVLHDGLADDLRAGRVDGVLAVGVDEETVRWIERQGVPAVAYAGAARWRVRSVSDPVIRWGVRQLAGAGCRRVGWWHPQMIGRAETKTAGSEYEKEDTRLSTFQAALAENDLSYHPELLVSGSNYIRAQQGRTQVTHQEQGYAATMDIFTTPGAPKPDGIVVDDDMMALGVGLALRKLELRIGHDVKVATFVNKGSTALLGYEDDFHVTTFEPADIVQAMFNMLETLMDGNTPDNAVTVVSSIQAGDE